MTDGEAPAGRLEEWVRTGATVIAPATLLGALLFYFGYVSARSQYEYFGIDVDTIGLGTQDYIMRSPQPLLVPLLTLTLVGIGSLALRTATRRRITATVTGADDEGPAGPDAASARRLKSIKHLARLCVIVGLVMVGAAVVLLFGYAYVRDWQLYSLVTPLLLAAGTALSAYGARTLHLARTNTEPAPTEPGHPHRPLLLGGSFTVLVYVVITAGIFWTTATVAQWSGRGLAQSQAQNLHRLPSVILDTKERLFLRSPGIEETALPESPGQTFRFRYRHLRLLIHGRDRMFLVPDRWSASNSTLVVTLNESVRVQFQFQNQAP